ncbi:MAG: branched-chain amino acid ABC transporter permease [Streptosporangiaceae bacterium]
MRLLSAAFGFGLVAASVLAIASVAFTLQFAVTDVLNLAFASVMTAGAFIAYLVNSYGISVWIGLLVAMVGCSLLSVLLNYFVYTPFQRRGSAPITLVIVSLGVALIVEFGIAAFVGGVSVSYAMSPGTTLHFGGLVLTTVQLIIMAISVAVMLSVHALLRYTRLGKAMRATAANRMLARSCGIRAGRVIGVTWALTGALCGLAGTVFAINTGSFDPTSTDIFLILMLAAVFLGGPGSAYGAMLGALIIGLATEVSAAYIPADYKYVIAFVALLVMLAVRPTGLLGART